MLMGHAIEKNNKQITYTNLLNKQVSEHSDL